MRFHTKRRRMPTVIIVSLIDIFVILLIFVIVTTTFKRPQPAVVIRLPEAKSEVEIPTSTRGKELVVVTVSKTGEIAIDEKVVSGESLAEALRPLVAAEHPLALRADTEAPFGIMLRVTEALKEAGVKGSLPAFTEIKKR